MKIVFLGGRGFHSNYGGVENAIRRITSELRAKYSDLEIYVTGHGKRNNFENIESKELPTILNSPIWASRLGHSFSCFLNMVYLIIFVRPNAIYFFASGPSLLSPIPRLFGIKTIACLRAVDSKRDKHSFVSRMILSFGERVAARYSSVCTANNMIQYEFARKYRDSARYIPNGVTLGTPCLKIFNHLDILKEEYLLFVARLDPAKQLHLLLEAYGNLPCHIKVPLVVVGGHNTDKDYVSLLEELATDGVIFTGHLDVESVAGLTKHCKVFVLPSLIEGMSNSLLMAAGYARPIICSNIRANRDVVNEDSRALFDVNSVESLEERLKQFLMDEDLRISVADDINKYVSKRFIWSQSADQFIQSLDIEKI